MKQLREITNEGIKFNILETSGVVKLNVFTEEHYHKVQNFLLHNKINSLNPKPERPIKFVLINLPIYFDCQEMTKALQLQSINVKHINQVFRELIGLVNYPEFKLLMNNVRQILPLTTAK